MKAILFLILAVTACQAVIPRSPSYWIRKNFDKQLTSNAIDDYPWVNQLWFTQKVDHFDQYNQATWQQKYYVNPKYYRNDSIIFLMIGGEGPENGHWAGNPNVQYLQWAQEYGALVFDVEHRFFGDSYPIPDMETSSLRLLTSTQALADLAYFIQSINKQYGFNNPRWVTFGGSYPGALAAWFRQKYPEYTVGSVASSGVVNLKLDFYEYAMGVDDDLAVTQPLCAQATKQAFAQIQNMTMTEAGRAQLNQQLHITPPFGNNTVKLDITNLMANLYSVYQWMSQYTYDGQSTKTETVQTDKTVCDIMTNVNGTTPNLVDRVYQLYNTFNLINGDNSGQVWNNYQSDVKTISTGNLTVLGDNAASRGWMWLCCNELGFLQTTDLGDNVFGSNIPLNYYIDMCSDMFGSSIDMNHVYTTNWNAQKYYGGADNYYATNIVLPNGSMDPWHRLGAYLNNATIGATAILINGTAHCSDMYPSYQGEPPALAPARAIIKSQVQQFIRYNPDLDGPTTATTLSTKALTTTSATPIASTVTPTVSTAKTTAAPSTTPPRTTLRQTIMEPPHFPRFLIVFETFT